MCVSLALSESTHMTMPKIVVIGGSAGSINVLKTILGGLPEDFPAAVLVATHIGARESMLPRILERCSALPVRHALQGEPIVAGNVLVAPADLHLTVAMDGERTFAKLTRGPKENHARPAIDPLFRSAAAAARSDAIAVLLSGFLDDGTVGLQAIKACGGIAVVQDPGDAEAPDMPASALQHASIDFVRSADDIASTLVELVGAAPGLAAGRTGAGRASWIAVENRMLEELSEMADLDQIGARVPLTCPECGGSLWEIHQSHPTRYRCHTGHAFTGKVLEALQRGEVEDALWAAVRALHEQERLFRQLHRKPPAHPGARPSPDDPRDEYLSRAEQAGEHAQVLRELIATRMHITAR